MVCRLGLVISGQSGTLAGDSGDMAPILKQVRSCRIGTPTCKLLSRSRFASPEAPGRSHDAPTKGAPWRGSGPL
jgi:hypothetical protein